jgi:hypothetical protein
MYTHSLHLLYMAFEEIYKIFLYQNSIILTDFQTSFPCDAIQTLLHSHIFNIYISF